MRRDTGPAVIGHLCKMRAVWLHYSDPIELYIRSLEENDWTDRSSDTNTRKDCDV